MIFVNCFPLGGGGCQDLGECVEDGDKEWRFERFLAQRRKSSGWNALGKFSCQKRLSPFNDMRLTVISFHLFSGEVIVHHDFKNSNSVGGGLCTPPERGHRLFKGL